MKDLGNLNLSSTVLSFNLHTSTTRNIHILLNYLDCKMSENGDKSEFCSLMSMNIMLLHSNKCYAATKQRTKG